MTQSTYIYKEYHSICPLVEIGTLPTPLSPASVPLPPEPGGGGGHTRRRMRGWGSIRNIVYAELDYKRLNSLHLLASVEHSVSFICYVLSMYCILRLLVRPESKSKTIPRKICFIRKSKEWQVMATYLLVKHLL
jgi:hypothetical protein